MDVCCACSCSSIHCTEKTYTHTTHTHTTHTHTTHTHTTHTHTTHTRAHTHYMHIQFFLRLHYHLNPHPKHSTTDGGNQPSLEWLRHIIPTRRVDPQFAESEGCVFATPIAAFSALVDEILGWLVQQVISVAKDNCKRYKRDKWAWLPVIWGGVIISTPPHPQVASRDPG